MPNAVLKTGTYRSCVSLFLLITGLSLTFPHMQSRRDALGCDSYCYGKDNDDPLEMNSSSRYL